MKVYEYDVKNYLVYAGDCSVCVWIAKIGKSWAKNKLEIISNKNKKALNFLHLSKREVERDVHFIMVHIYEPNFLEEFGDWQVKTIYSGAKVIPQIISLKDGFEWTRNLYDYIPTFFNVLYFVVKKGKKYINRFLEI